MVRYRFKLALLCMAATVMQGSAVYHDRSGYIDPGMTGTDFAGRLLSWRRGEKWSEDDNFFISRVKPRERFINRRTQVNSGIDDQNDKNLIWWMPVGTPPFNALPGGEFDSEVISAWSYITHLGDWSAPLARVPGALLDAAHRNGVPVSALAAIPYGDLDDDWYQALRQLSAAGSSQLADYLSYYGVDGIGYNSEFQARPSLVKEIIRLNRETVSRMREDGNNSSRFIWYDGTNSSGAITFDCGLGAHNKELWGTGEDDHSLLFLNYNWTTPWLLSESTDSARTYGRTPLDLYCGINMQGREPKETRDGLWSLLARYPLSIGLWGGHSENMFFESRADNALSAIDRQRNYLARIERWFSGSRRNPADSPDSESLIYSVNGGDFPGMARFMSARSALKWDLSAEPFHTAFNLGNGRFFNYEGRRCHDSRWYNLSVQDYLPTWMWWWAQSWLGHDIPESMTAEFTWDDAWTGGSCLRIYGSSSHCYLHLFKTEFPLRDGDRITVRFKRLNGTGALSLAMSLKDTEETPVKSTLPLLSETPVQLGLWQEKTFTVGEDIIIPPGSEVAVLGLEFFDTCDLDIRLGTLEIRRHSETVTPDSPIIESARLMYADRDGADAKVIFSMPQENHSARCLNEDVNTSLFKIYSRADDEKPILMGLTTSWAALPCDIPFSGSEDSQIRIGVSALSLDRSSESEITWSDPMDISEVYVSLPPEEVTPVPAGQEPPELAILSTGGEEVTDFSSIPAFSTEDNEINISYILKEFPSPASRGLNLDKNSAGFPLSGAGIYPGDSFAVEFSIRPANDGNPPSHLVSIRDKRGSWPENNYGWFYHTLNPDGTTEEFAIRDIDGTPFTFSTGGFRLTPGQWHTLRYEFHYSDIDNTLTPRLVLDGDDITVSSLHPEGLLPHGGWSGWSRGMMFEIGGYIHRKNPVGGIIDDLRIIPITPAGEEIIFDFEEDPADDNSWHLSSSSGSAPSFGLIGYEDTETEGQGIPRFIPPLFAAGSPDAPGNRFTDLHTARWHTPGAISVSHTVAAEGGEARIRYDGGSGDDNVREYPIILELSNSCGTSVYDMVIRHDGSGIGIIETTQRKFKPVNTIFDSSTGVRVEDEGTYTLSLLDMSGRTLLSNVFNASPGDVLLIYPEVSPGPYLLTLTKEGETVGSATILKR